MNWSIPRALLDALPLRLGLVNLTARTGERSVPGERAAVAYLALRRIVTMYNRGSPYDRTVDLYMSRDHADILATEIGPMRGFLPLYHHLRDHLESHTHVADGQEPTGHHREPVREARKLRFQC